MIIDVENEVLDTISTVISDIEVRTTFQKDNLVYPLITFAETSNVADEATYDSAGENKNQLAFEVNIFTNGNLKKSDAKAIASRVDDILSGNYRMRRVTSDYISNYLDNDNYRYVIIYTCLVDENRKIYRR